MSGPFTTPVGVSVPFDGTVDSQGNPVLPPFISDNVKDGIIEARDTAPGRDSRYVQIFAYQGKSSNKWLECFFGMPTKDNPFVLNEQALITGFSVRGKKWDVQLPTHFEVYKNGALMHLLIVSDIPNTPKFTISGLRIVLQDGDEISIKALKKSGTRGSIKEPQVYMFLKAQGVVI